MARASNGSQQTRPILAGSLFATLARVPGLGSVRGRYLYAASFFALFLLIAAWLAQSLVWNTATESGANLADRGQVLRLIRELDHRLWNTQSNLQTFVLIPGSAEQAATVAALDAFGQVLGGLSANTWLARSAEAQGQVAALSLDYARLQPAVRHLIEVRVNAEKLFPAMGLMINRMLPLNTEFDTAVALAIEEADQLAAVPGQHDVRRLFSDARFVWTRAISSFRMYVASRFGIFPGRPEDGMHEQARNIAVYLQSLNDYLTQLEELDRRGALEFQQSESLGAMRRSARDWQRAYHAATAIYTSERWRSDLPLLRDAIHPLFADLWRTLRALEQDIHAVSSGELAGLADTAARLSEAMWLIALLGIAVTIGGFLFFERTVSRPIARVAQALKAEARGEAGVALSPTHTAETRDLTEAFDHMRRQVHSRQQRLETILDNAAEGILTFDDGAAIQSLNQAAERLFGYSEAEVRGDTLDLLIPPPGAHDRRAHDIGQYLTNEILRLIGREGEVLGRHKDGRRFPVALKISRIELEGRTLYTGLVADISERKALLEHLKDMAEHDGLTGLYNRSYFQAELERVVERCRRAGAGAQPCGLLYVDLDNFKYINDTLGHAAGDRLLIDIAGILGKRARRSDLIARLGGDEFTVLLYNTPFEQAAQVAESFRHALAEHQFRHETERMEVSCSIGVSAITAETPSATQSLAQADLACHLAKRGGRNRVHVFNDRDQANVTTMALDMGWSRRIRQAIRHNRFALACQPIVHIQTRRAEAYEVLVRMVDDNGDLIMPGGFLPSAERFGLSVELDRWVIQKAIELLAGRRRQNPGLRYSINLSGQTLNDPGVCDLIVEQLQRRRLDPAALTFEVTETVAITDMPRAEAFLMRLQAIGCRTALDDFGSGFSSFAYLKDLPVNEVKIDGRFVKNLAVSPLDQALVRAMNDIAHVLDKKTVAEFVEDEASFLLLRDYGVDYCQGYHLGQPQVVPPVQAGESPGLTGRDAG
jgi:diguanylate cyclase (GGDEF)-like protein/PAS domain S-box-containing protein